MKSSRLIFLPALSILLLGAGCAKSAPIELPTPAPAEEASLGTPSDVPEMVVNPEGEVKPVEEPKPAPVPAPAPVSAVKTFTVTASNFAFDVKEMRVKQGDKVKIIVKNSGGFHDFKLDEFSVATAKLGDGDSETVEFTADKKGAFEYYCSVGSHRAMGMKGNLIVE